MFCTSRYPRDTQVSEASHFVEAAVASPRSKGGEKRVPDAWCTHLWRRVPSCKAVATYALRAGAACGAAYAAGTVGQAAGTLQGYIASVPLMTTPSPIEGMIAWAPSVGSVAQAVSWGALAAGGVLGQRKRGWFGALWAANAGASCGVLGWSAAYTMGAKAVAAVAAGGAYLSGVRVLAPVFFGVNDAVGLPLGVVGGVLGVWAGVHAARGPSCADLEAPCKDAPDDPLEHV